MLWTSHNHSISQLFRRHLAVVPADTAELLDQSYRLRFQVYCVERRFENAAEYPDGRERDRYDRRSLHALLIDRLNGAAVGTVRLILPRCGEILPVFGLKKLSSLRRSLPSLSTAEVSRFAVARSLRRPLETSWLSGNGLSPALPIITIGLLQAIVTMCSSGGITHIVALMEPALLRLLRRMSIEFHPVGDLVEHHGLRQAGWAVLADLLERVKECNREVWEIATDRGARKASPHARSPTVALARG